MAYKSHQDASHCIWCNWFLMDIRDSNFEDGDPLSFVKNKSIVELAVIVPPSNSTKNPLTIFQTSSKHLMYLLFYEMKLVGFFHCWTNPLADQKPALHSPPALTSGFLSLLIGFASPKKWVISINGWSYYAIDGHHHISRWDNPLLFHLWPQAIDPTPWHCDVGHITSSPWWLGAGCVEDICTSPWCPLVFWDMSACYVAQKDLLYVLYMYICTYICVCNAIRTHTHAHCTQIRWCNNNLTYKLGHRMAHTRSSNSVVSGWNMLRQAIFEV